MKFKIKSGYQPAGDQPKAIKQLTDGINKGFDRQTLLGVTGSGKTFTMANVIQNVQMPTLVIAHNKTLAAQLCNEFREFFPENAVEYFVSYYDYYQPEAYMPASDTYIEKESQINEEIDRLRHACTQALLTREDVIIVASVSAIYGLGSPKEYEKIVLHLRRGDTLDRKAMLEQLVAMQFERTPGELKRGQFRLKGQVFEIMPVNEDAFYRFEISDKIDVIELVDSLTRKVKKTLEDAWFFPAKHYVVGPDAQARAFKSIKAELENQLTLFERQGKVLEHERLKRRVAYDLEMIKNIGYCNGIENYSRHFEGRGEGEPPFTLLDYFKYSTNVISIPTKSGEKSLILRSRRKSFPSDRRSEEDSFDTDRDSSSPLDSPFRARSGSLGMTGGNRGFLTIIDESHVTVSQIRGMYNGDKARKDTLVEHGFRLPSARDNRPLQFAEFDARVGQTVFVSATPAEYEIQVSQQVAEQVVRPTGLIDPEVVVRPIVGGKSTVIPTTGGISVGSRPGQKSIGGVNLPVGRQGPAWDDKNVRNLSQIEDLIVRIEQRIAANERVLVTTLTKKMAEDLTEYLKEKKISAIGGPASGWKVAYLHSDVDTLDRIQIISDLRRGAYDVIVGVNLLREGLDMPEVSLVAILDADKEGFLRSETSLIQTIGRAARNVNGQVVLYADHMTGSMQRAIDETQRRRKIQIAYNEKHGITPKTIQKTITNLLEQFGISADRVAAKAERGGKARKKSTAELDLLGDGRPLEIIVKDKEVQMKEAAQKLEFELAAILRDEVRELRARLKTTETKKSPVKRKK